MGAGLTDDFMMVKKTRRATELINLVQACWAPFSIRVFSRGVVLSAIRDKRCER